MKAVSYRTEKSNGDHENSPYRISLDNSQQNDMRKELPSSSVSSPIVVEPLQTQDQKSSRSNEDDSGNEFQRTESVNNVPHITEQLNTNQTEDRNDNIKDEPATDHVLIQDNNTAVKPLQIRIPYKKPDPENADDFKYINEEAMKQSIVNKVIQNINEHHDEESQLNFKSSLSDMPLKLVSVDSIETERQKYYPPSPEQSSPKSQPLSDMPMRLFGYDPSIVGSLYNMQVHYDRPSQIQQPPNTVNQGYKTGLEAHSDDIRPQPQTHDSSGAYFSQPISTIQVGSYKGNQKHAEPLYYYDPVSMSMLQLPVYTNMLQNTYLQQQDNKANPTPPINSNKNNGFNLMQILNGGSFYRGTEQAEVSQQTAVKDSIVKQDLHKQEKAKPSEKVKLTDTKHNKIRPQQPLMFYMGPDNKPFNLNSFASNPTQFSYGQQPQADCNGQSHKAPALKVDKPLQPIPLCSECNPTLALMGLSSSTSAMIQQKKSSASPQRLPLWDGQHVSKINYLIFPNPITK